MKKIILLLVLILAFSDASIAQFNKMYDFSGLDGGYSRGTFISDGTYLYGNSYGGGSMGAGALFKIKPDGTGFTKLLDFNGGATGFYPLGALISDGTFLYGTATEGGANAKGTVFKIKPDGTSFVRLLSFTGTANGNSPGPLISDGVFLYGTTHKGGTSNMGVLYKIKPDGTSYTKLIDFTGSANGNNPAAALFFDGTYLYGVTSWGGTSNFGTIFKIKPDGTEFTKLFDFAGTTTGRSPYGTLVFDGVYFYGTTYQGGTDDFGTIFKIKPDGSEYTKLWEFGSSYGVNPASTLFPVGDFFYGMTQSGGTNTDGTLYRIKADGTGFSSLVNFNSLKGTSPWGGLVSDGMFLYGLTDHGGLNNKGTVFKYNLLCTDTIINQAHVVCPGQNVTVNGNTYSVSGTYYDSLSSYHGCDSIIITSLTVLPDTLYEQTVTICNGDSAVIGSGFYTASGNYTDTLVSFMNGCDSIITTHLTVLPANLSIQSYTICSGDSITVGTNIYSSNGNYTDVFTSFIDGCDSTVTTHLTVNTVNTAVSISNTGFIAAASPAVYQWINCSNGNIPVTGQINQSYLPTDNNSYAVIVTQNSCIDTSSCYSVVLVWPGDTDNDSLVNNNDLLPIGLYYGQAGTPRTSISDLWTGFLSADWGTLQTNGSDIKHSDSNGNGVIDDNDTLAINQNFNLTHAITTIGNSGYLTERTAPNLYFVTSGNSYGAGDWVNVEVWLGNSVTPANNLYGIAFNIDYESGLVEPGTEYIVYPSSWLGNSGTNVFTLSKIDALAHTAYGAITRINHTNASGYGKIANFKFKVKTSLIGSATMQLSVSGYRANDASGSGLVFNTLKDSVSVNPLTTGIGEISNDIRMTIYPNPFTSQTTIVFAEDQKQSQVTIKDVLGKEIRTFQFTGKELIIERKTMQNGIYFIYFVSGTKTVIKKIIVR
ncbi:MAG: choice-of-anchor tandem repeat GloVer-containing protein [Bacteroidota bacterium]